MPSDQPQVEALPSVRSPFYRDDWLEVWHGDCRAVMAGMPAESVHMVCTSPPYWGLRDYGTATWQGGDPECDHVRPNARMAHERRASTLGGGVATVAAQDAGANAEAVCGRCGATRVDSQLGLEATPEEYVANLVAVFREVKRVLRPDGTVWLNLGDSYAGARAEGGGTMAGFNDRYFGRETDGGKQAEVDTSKPGRPAVAGLKPKDLVGIPWRVAFALQADGWYLRSDIIWSKPNPMPESVTDRPTKSHEYIFLLSKSPRYYFDADAVREGLQTEPHVPGNRRIDPFKTDRGHLEDRQWGDSAGRNIRSVWTMATQPYPGVHFATFPESLPERCIKAGCPEGGTVLDCFAGSGTTGMVAQSLSRRAVLIDLSLDYLGQLMARNREIPLGLTS